MGLHSSLHSTPHSLHYSLQAPAPPPWLPPSHSLPRNRVMTSSSLLSPPRIFHKRMFNIWGYGNDSDPYVIVDMGGQKKKTQNISGNINPEFPASTSTFTFNGKGSGGQVTFKIMDHDPMSADDEMGTASHVLKDGELEGGLITVTVAGK